jgi:phosphatidate cytidylyltransferase
MLRRRVVTGLALAAALLATLLYGSVPFVMAVFAGIVALGAWEWSRFGGLQHAASRLIYVLVVAAAMWGVHRLTMDPSQREPVFIVACLWWIAAFIWLSCAPSRQHRILTFGCGILALAPAFVALAELRDLPHGAAWVLWLLVIVFGADIGAFFVGHAFGRIKLAPRVSPGKTWEGAIGGLAVSALVGASGAWWFSLPRLLCIVFALAVGIASIVGDLTESMFKRAAGLKDSGGLLPGHGGILDRIDSVLAAAPFFVLGLLRTGVIP